MVKIVMNLLDFEMFVREFLTKEILGMVCVNHLPMNDICSKITTWIGKHGIYVDLIDPNYRGCEGFDRDLKTKGKM